MDFQYNLNLAVKDLKIKGMSSHRPLQIMFLAYPGLKIGVRILSSAKPK